MKIFAIGMNYAAHNKELQRLQVGDANELVKPDEPVIFTKADSALLKPGKPFFVPDFMGRIDYEAELVFRICRLGKSIPERFAHRYYDAVTVGIDFTARDMQQAASQKGQPWTICKGFDGSAYSVDQMISYISRFFTLKTGDLLYTGTPAGVGPVQIGDHLEGWLGERKVLDLHCK